MTLNRPGAPTGERVRSPSVRSRTCDHDVVREDVRGESSGSRDDLDEFADRVDGIAAEVGLSGAIRIDVERSLVVQRAYGLAHRGLGVPNTVDTQFAIASGSKGLTALVVMSLVERGELGLDTTARSVLGGDLALIDDRVTVEQLLAHRSGIGDYLDEDEVNDNNDYVLTVPVHELATTEQFLAVLDGHPMKHEPGERFVYCNGGYVVLALLAERISGVPFHDLVDQQVCRPAGMTDTSFLRSDELPGRAAAGYLDDDGLRTNVLHLPVRGNGDGGIYTTAADVRALWDALFAGRIVSLDTVAEMVRPRNDAPELSMRYGLGFWLDDSTNAVSLHGFDAGVGFVSTHHRDRRVTSTVLCNQTRGAWPVSQRLNQLLAAST
jgi:CubicO group peptidase (beta-lactamase class C family)